MAAGKYKQKRLHGILAQLWSTYALTLSCFLTGFFLIWSPNAIFFLQSAKSPIGQLSLSKVKLLDKLPLLTIFLPALFGSVLSDIIGRKKAKIFYGICYTVSWLLIATASCPTDFVVGYTISFVTAKMDFVTVHAYISEVSQNSIRGVLLSMYSLQFCLGAITAHLAEFYLSYNMKNYFCLALSTLHLLLVSALKDTPSFLLMKDNEVKALDSLKFYRGTKNATEEITNELSDLRQLLSEGTTENKHVQNPDNTNAEILKRIRNELNVWQIIDGSVPICRALYWMMFLLSCIALSGSSFVQTYTVHCVEKIYPKIDHKHCSIIVSTATLAGSVLGVVFIDLMPRRNLFLRSSCVCTFCAFMIAIIVKWNISGAWIALVAGIVYAVFFQAGVRNVALVQMAEMFQPRVKCSIIGFASCCIAICNLLMIMYGNNIVAFAGVDGILFLITLIGYFTTLLAFFFLKETRNTPVTEIMQMYAAGYLFKHKVAEKSLDV